MNTLVTPRWIVDDAREALLLRAKRAEPVIGDTIRIVHPKALTLSGKSLLVLGAAAVVANPAPISRRSLLGLGWKRS